jgi:hypothetical protein
MRRVVGVVVALGVLIGSAPAAAAPVRGCKTRGEGQRPLTRLVSPGDLQIGPVAFFGLARLADAKEFAHFGPATRGRHLIKVPLKVRAGRVVTVSVDAVDRGIAALTFDPSAELRTGVPAVRFAACEKRERAWSYDGTVGPVTAFPGGFSLAGPACVHLTVRVRGRAQPYRRVVPFGTGDC